MTLEELQEERYGISSKAKQTNILPFTLSLRIIPQARVGFEIVDSRYFLLYLSANFLFCREANSFPRANL